MKERKDKEKGSVTMIVIFVIFFIVILLSTFLVYVTAKRNNQLKETEKLSEIYNEDMQEVYEGRKNRKGGIETEISLFDTQYGRVDIVWLDTSNNIVSKPDSPSNNLYGMIPIYWDEQNKEIETTSSNRNWYEYISISEKEDNLTSKWANAKNSDGSYFVWIPRYAYRITYYSDKESDVPTGYCDARGIVDSRWKCEIFSG